MLSYSCPGVCAFEREIVYQGELNYFMCHSHVFLKVSWVFLSIRVSFSFFETKIRDESIYEEEWLIWAHIWAIDVWICSFGASREAETCPETQYDKPSTRLHLLKAHIITHLEIRPSLRGLWGHVRFKLYHWRCWGIGKTGIYTSTFRYILLGIFQAYFLGVYLWLWTKLLGRLFFFSASEVLSGMGFYLSNQFTFWVHVCRHLNSIKK